MPGSMVNTVPKSWLRRTITASWCPAVWPHLSPQQGQIIVPQQHPASDRSPWVSSCLPTTHSPTPSTPGGRYASNNRGEALLLGCAFKYCWRLEKEGGLMECEDIPIFQSSTKQLLLLKHLLSFLYWYNSNNNFFAFVIPRYVQCCLSPEIAETAFLQFLSPLCLRQLFVSLLLLGELLFASC